MKGGGLFVGPAEKEEDSAAERFCILNMAAIVDKNSWSNEAQSDDEVEVPNTADDVVESESEDDEVGADLLAAKVDVAPVKVASGPAKKLSKSEKMALKKKELEEMDDIFSEMGITLETTPAAAVEASPVEERTENSDKDKKKKKKKAVAKAKPVGEAPVAVVEIPLTPEEIKAKLLAKTAALGKKAAVVPVAVSEALKEKKEKKKVYGNYDL